MEFIERKLQADKIATLYKEIGYDSYANRIRECARYVRFVQKSFWVAEYNDYREVIGADEVKTFRLTDAVFCRVRLCPICQWRKSKRWQALALRNYPLIKKRYPNYRWLFLTLTIKTCKLSRLHSTIKRLNKSFLKWVKWKSFPAEGWIKSLEVTLSENDSTRCHPHFHVLLMVPNSYFSNPQMYLTQLDWANAWGKAAKLSYDPIVDIRAVKQGKEKEIIPELLKYGVKPSDLANATAEQLKSLTEQLHGIHAVNKGGLLRNCFQDVGSDNVNLIGSSEQQGTPTGYELKMLWDYQVKGYQNLYFNHKKLEGVVRINESNFQSNDLVYEAPSPDLLEKFSI